MRGQLAEGGQQHVAVQASSPWQCRTCGQLAEARQQHAAAPPLQARSASPGCGCLARAGRHQARAAGQGLLRLPWRWQQSLVLLLLVLLVLLHQPFHPARRTAALSTDHWLQYCQAHWLASVQATEGVLMAHDHAGLRTAQACGGWARLAHGVRVKHVLLWADENAVASCQRSEAAELVHTV